MSNQPSNSQDWGMPKLSRVFTRQDSSKAVESASHGIQGRVVFFCFSLLHISTRLCSKYEYCHQLTCVIPKVVGTRPAASLHRNIARFALVPSFRQQTVAYSTISFASLTLSVMSTYDPCNYSN